MALDDIDPMLQDLVKQNDDAAVKDEPEQDALQKLIASVDLDIARRQSPARVGALNVSDYIGDDWAAALERMRRITPLEEAALAIDKRKSDIADMRAFLESKKSEATYTDMNRADLQASIADTMKKFAMFLET